MLPAVNQILYIQVAASDDEESQQEYKTRIADESERELWIEIPVSEGAGNYKRLFIGDELSACYLTPDGVKHYFNSHVLGFKEDQVRLIRIQRPEANAITKIQRRHYLRVGASLELAIQLSPKIRFIGVTDDVGGGGISFLADVKWSLEVGRQLDCWLLIPYRNGTIEHAQFKAEVVRIRPVKPERNQVMIKFSSISEGERQKIIRYCFERQLDIRKK